MPSCGTRDLWGFTTADFIYTAQPSVEARLG